MTDQLDPDQRTCPRCGARPGQVCRTAAGRTAHTVHHARRQPTPNPPTPRPSPATPTGRSKGAATTAANRRKGRATVAAIVGEVRARQLEDEACRQAADAVLWDRTRMGVRWLTLRVASTAAATFVEALEGYARTRLDDDGRPRTVPVEVEPGKVREVVDKRGGFGPDDVKALAGAYAVAIDRLRLEEGSATSRTEVVAGVDLSDEELRRLGSRALEDLARLEQDTGGAP